MKLKFDNKAVFFRRCPFPGSSVYPKGNVPHCSIRDVDPDAKPPEIRTLDGETLFVPAAQRADFLQVIKDQSFNVVKRPDIWCLILEPFLDTEFSAEQSEQTLRQLEEFGMSRDEVSQTRIEVKAAMLSYNSPLGDWLHLGLYDVLHAMRNTLTITSLINRFSSKRYAKFYRYAMKTAELGNRHPGTPKS